MYCCKGLEILVDNAGSRGLSVLVYNTAGGFVFNIQARAISKESEEELLQSPTSLPLDEKNVSIASNIGLNYCPYCGTHLQSLINPNTRKDFELLALRHKKIDPRPY
jgi:hypothetical protein